MVMFRPPRRGMLARTAVALVLFPVYSTCDAVLENGPPSYYGVAPTINICQTGQCSTRTRIP